MAYRAGSFPLSRSCPAGKATAAWKNTQTPISQKMCPLDQRWASCSVSSADVNAYSEELMPSMPIHGKSTMVHRGRPMMSRSVSPMRYLRPLVSVTSLYGTGFEKSVVVIFQAPLASKDLDSAPCQMPFVRLRVTGVADAHRGLPRADYVMNPPPNSPAVSTRRYSAR